MTVLSRAFGELGVAYLVASIEVVLEQAQVEEEQLGPKEIGDRAGIPENSFFTQEIVTAFLHYLIDERRVERTARGVYELV